MVEELTLVFDLEAEALLATEPVLGADLGAEVVLLVYLLNDLGADLEAEALLVFYPPLIGCYFLFFICSLTSKRPSGTVNSIKLAIPPRAGLPPF